MVLRAIEQKIEALFEGVFGRAFRTNVQPVELARKLAKEMDDHRTISVSRVYVPNEYTVYLVLELQEYLAEHARRESYALLSSPRVVLETDDDLEIGEFGIATRMTQPKGSAEPEPEPGATMIYKPKTPVAQQTEAVSPEELGMEREVVALTANGQRYEIAKRRSTIGRSKECDVQ